MGIFEDILAAAETLISPSSYAPNIGAKRSAELDAINAQQSSTPLMSGLGLSSTSATQASPLEVERAKSLAESNRSRAFQKMAQAKEAEDTRAVTEMLSLLQSQSSPSTQSFAVKGDKMLAGPGLPGRGGNFSKTKAIPSETEKGLKAIGLPAEFAAVNPEVMKQLALLKSLGIMTPDEKAAASSKQKFDFLGEIMKSDTTDQVTREAILAQTLPEIFKLIQALKAAEENK